MTWQVRWAGRAERALAGLPRHVQLRILERLTQYCSTGQGDVKKLQGAPGYRLRVGDYRVVFERLGNELVILVVYVGHRREIYR